MYPVAWFSVSGRHSPLPEQEEQKLISISYCAEVPDLSSLAMKLDKRRLESTSFSCVNYARPKTWGKWEFESVQQQIWELRFKDSKLWSAPLRTYPILTGSIVVGVHVNVN